MFALDLVSTKHNIVVPLTVIGKSGRPVHHGDLIDTTITVDIVAYDLHSLGHLSQGIWEPCPLGA